MCSCCGFATAQTETVTTISNPSPNVDTLKGPLPKMEFVSMNHNFGKIKEGRVYTWSYEFTNTGSTDLIISHAQGNCGCTVPEYPHQPIHPGEKEAIRVSFDASGKAGNQNKMVTLTTNCSPNTVVLTLEADIYR